MKGLLLTLVVLLVTFLIVALAGMQWQNVNLNFLTSDDGTVQSQNSQSNNDSLSVKISVYENSFPINETSPMTKVKTFISGNGTQRNYMVESSGMLYPHGTTDALDTRFLEDKDNVAVIERVNWGDVQALPDHGGAQLTSNTRTLTIINDGTDAVTISIPVVIANYADYKVSIYNYTLFSDPTQILQSGQKAVIAIFLYVSTPSNTNPDPAPFSIEINIIATKVSN